MASNAEIFNELCCHLDEILSWPHNIICVTAKKGELAKTFLPRNTLARIITDQEHRDVFENLRTVTHMASPCSVRIVFNDGSDFNFESENLWTEEIDFDDDDELYF